VLPSQSASMALVPLRRGEILGGFEELYVAHPSPSSVVGERGPSVAEGKSLVEYEGLVRRVEHASHQSAQDGGRPSRSGSPRSTTHEQHAGPPNQAAEREGQMRSPCASGRANPWPPLTSTRGREKALKWSHVPAPSQSAKPPRQTQLTLMRKVDRSTASFRHASLGDLDAPRHEATRDMKLSDEAIKTPRADDDGPGARR